MFAVKIITDDDGSEYPNSHWHMSDPCSASGSSVLCTDEFYGIGESSCTFQVKKYRPGVLTCPDCIYMINAYQKIKL